MAESGTSTYKAGMKKKPTITQSSIEPKSSLKKERINPHRKPNNLPNFLPSNALLSSFSSSSIKFLISYGYFPQYTTLLTLSPLT